MSSLWPWLAVAALGAVHGLNPVTGWMFAAARGVRSGDRVQVLWALIPLGVGHAASVAIVAVVVTLGPSMDRTVLQVLAGLLLGVVAVLRLSGDRVRRTPSPASQVGLALWSFIISTAHGAGLMLVPALIPLCMADAPAREITASGSLMLALAAVCVHAAAMLAVTGAIAFGVCRWFEAGTRLLHCLSRKWFGRRERHP